MAKKKVINAGKVMVIAGAVVILVLVGLWCSSLLKMSHEQKNASPSGVVTQSTMSANVIVPPITTTTTVTTNTEPVQTTSSYAEETTTETVTSYLTVKGDGGFQEYIIKLANPALEIYSEPSYNSMVTSTITDRGSYIIIKETVDDDGNKWGLLEDSSGWINLADARKTGEEDTTENTSDTETSTNTTENNDENNINNSQDNGNNSYTGNPNGGLMGIDADGDGWDDGFNPDAWCPYCGYDSYYNSADGNYYCSQGHVWSY